MKKRMMFMMMAIMMMGCFLIPQNIHAKSTPWYRTVMKARKKKGFKYYRLLDINQDGKKELLLSTTKNSFITYEDKVEVWVRRKGKSKKIYTKPISYGGGAMFYLKKEKTLINGFRGSGESHEIYYKLKKGALKKIKRLDIYSPYHDPGNNSNKPAYYINGKKVSAKKGEKASRKVTANMQISYKKIK